MAQTNAVAVREATVDAVMNRVRALESQGDLDLPENYSAPNALKSAWLTLQEAKDKDKQPVIEVCTRESIANALLSMVLQGLTPAKNQVYFVAHGSHLTCMRSYFGTMAVLRQVRPDVGTIESEIVYAGDDFKYRIERGMKVISDHQQTLDSVDAGKIRAAYCTVFSRDGAALASEIMTYREIMASWKQSRNNPVNDNGTLRSGSVHAKFTSEMAKRTVIQRACKNLINASDDSGIMARVAKGADPVEMARAVAVADIERNANQGPLIDMDAQPAMPQQLDLDVMDDPAAGHQADESGRTANEPELDEIPDAVGAPY